MADPAEYHKMLPKEHVDFLNTLLDRYGVPPLPEGATAALAMHNWSDQVSRKQVELALSYPIRLIANALGPPPKDIVDLCHAKGVKVAALVGSKKHAKKQVEQGVDVIVAQGTEAGGHCGEISTLVLVPEVVEAVAPVPVVAAGGIGSGQQLGAVLALGAQAGWAGSIWLTTEEGTHGSAVTRKLLQATSADTVRSKSISGKPARQLVTTWSKTWDDPQGPQALPMPLQFLLTAEAVARVHRHAEETGSDELLTSPIGQIVGRMNRVRPAREVVEEIKTELVATQKRLAALTF
jgi:NAD(P)H-dependent flavin oxidoreductase YrpB (nitropropane dioxygenase family)